VIRRGLILVGVIAGVMSARPALAQTVPPPKPFPTGSTPPARPDPQAPATAPVSPQDGASVDPRLAGVPIYPGAELLFSFDASRGQYLFTFGTDMPYSDIVAYYKNQLRASGTEVFRTPLIYQFDLGQFRAETMAYRPSVVVKDYSTPETQGYMHVSGTTEKRYRTVIQIVPVNK
jgi:hypothetical protein